MASSSRSIFDRWRVVSAALLAGVLLGSSGVVGTAHAVVFLSQNEALALVFPEADRIERETHVVKSAELDAVQKRARSKLETRIVKFFVGYKGDELLGHAYIDVHTVRTLPEAFLVMVTPDGTVGSLRVLAFHEPLDYLPPDSWFGQFDDKGLAQPLKLGGDVHGIMGATLSTRAVTSAVRRVLALWELFVRPELGTTVAAGP